MPVLLYSLHSLQCSFVFISYICIQPNVIMSNNIISSTLKSLRKEHSLTQVDLAMKSGVGLNFVRELEQGKATVRMDKVTQVFDLFGYELVPQRKVK